ncbi:MAG: c-type cytochrome [Campylobacterota bacterium]|nr:c-type cytochrome [Campylobacterota bacterium]
MKNILVLIMVVPFALFASDADFDNGKRLYEQTCISCHGVKGDANTDMNLVVKPRNLTKSILTEKQIYNIVKDGSHKWGSKSDIMGAFTYVYNKQELEDISLYVFNSFVKKQNENFKKLLNDSSASNKITLKRGKKIFKRNCSLCHGLRGDGESDYVEQSKGQDSFIYPYNLQKIILNENQIFLYAKYGGKYWGTDKDDMPSWNKKYSDNDLKSVAKYINEFIKK